VGEHTDRSSCRKWGIPKVYQCVGLRRLPRVRIVFDRLRKSPSHVSVDCRLSLTSVLSSILFVMLGSKNRIIQIIIGWGSSGVQILVVESPFLAISIVIEGTEQEIRITLGSLSTCLISAVFPRRHVRLLKLTSYACWRSANSFVASATRSGFLSG
jgi:hypothetical protein